MKYVSCSAIALAMLLVVAPPPAFARAPAADTTAKSDQNAIEALTKMGGYLRTVKAFDVRAAVTTEDVLLDGQKVQSTRTATLVAEKPDRPRLDVTDEHHTSVYTWNLAPSVSAVAYAFVPPKYANKITTTTYLVVSPSR